MKVNNPLYQIFFWFLAIIVVILLLFSCNKQEFKIPPNPYDISLDTNAFHYGDTLLPDYSHIDTLIVVDEKALNWIFDGVDNPVPATDGEIATVLYKYCETTAGHQCRWRLCPYKGIFHRQWHDKVQEYVGNDESFRYSLDILHLQEPTWEYDQLHEAIIND